MRTNRNALLGLAVAVVSAGCLGRPIQPTPLPVRTVAPTRTSLAVGFTASGLPEVSIISRDASFEAPDEIPAGWLSVSLRNQASVQRNAQFFRINPGVSLDELATALATDEYPVPRLVQFAGGLGTVPPGRTQTTVMELSEGQYAMVSLIHNWYLEPKVPPGMVKLFRVVASSAARAAEALPQQDDGQVLMVDHAYALPGLTAGAHTFKLVNQGQQPHEILIRQTSPGRTITDARAYMDNPNGQPPPYDESGSGGALVFGPGKTAWMTLDLTPGNYIGICFVRDPSTGKMHSELGMLTEFVVR